MPRPLDRLRSARHVSGVREIGADLISLLLPVGCAGCGRWDVGICPSCRALWRGPLRRCEDETVSLAAQEHPPRPALPVWALTAYRGGARRMIVQWKNHGRADLGPFFTDVGGHIARQVVPLLAGAQGPEGLTLVPAPSGWRRRLRRQLVVADLARAVATGLDQSSGAAPGAVPPVHVADVLRTPDGSLHRLGASQRTAARRVRLRPGRAVRRAVRGPVLLVDDVVTTGATLAACRRVLEARGARVLGAVVLAATPSPGSTIWR